MGYYTPFLIFGTCVAAIGAGLFLLLEIDTTVGQWIGYQIVYGLGLGACFQAPNMAAQTILPKNEVPVGVSLILFATTIFGAIFVSVGQNVLDQSLAGRLRSNVGLDITPKQIEEAGITGLINSIPDSLRNNALQDYNLSLRRCFLVALIIACLAIPGSLGMEWRSVKARKTTSSSTEDEKSEAFEV